jgi:hypothetical protein
VFPFYMAGVLSFYMAGVIAARDFLLTESTSASLVSHGKRMGPMAVLADGTRI